jgi:hypothetical protein
MLSLSFIAACFPALLCIDIATQPLMILLLKGCELVTFKSSDEQQVTSEELRKSSKK